MGSLEGCKGVLGFTEVCMGLLGSADYFWTITLGITKGIPI